MILSLLCGCTTPLQRTRRSRPRLTERHENRPGVPGPGVRPGTRIARRCLIETVIIGKPILGEYLENGQAAVTAKGPFLALKGVIPARSPAMETSFLRVDSWVRDIRAMSALLRRCTG
jgi:hypothetical protein